MSNGRMKGYGGFAQSYFAVVNDGEDGDDVEVEVGSSYMYDHTQFSR